MTQCENCHVSVKGDWETCPLCDEPLKDKEDLEAASSSFLGLPLNFNRQKAYQIFFRLSLCAVLLYFAINYFWTFQFFGLEYVIFGLLITWTLIVIFIRKRRNITKAIIYTLFFISLASVYLDYINGWIGWSLTFVIPIVSISSLLAMFISIQVVHLKIEDYILYLQLASLFGLIPLAFLIMGWVGHPLPSILSVILSLVLFVGILLRYRTLVIEELQKRMHI